MNALYEKWQQKYPAVFRNIRVSFSSSTCGVGLFTKRYMEKGEIIYTDEPLVAMQHLFSRRTYLACYLCFRTIGGLYHLMDHILQNVDKSLASTYPEILDSLTAENETCLIGSLFLPDGFSCPKECGAIFCSQSCLQLAIERHHHRILCIEMTASQRWKWKRFVRHAQHYHENFILAGYTFGEIVCMTKYLGYSLQAAMEEFSMFYQKPWYELEGPSNVIMTAENSEEFLSSKSNRMKIMLESLQFLHDCLLDSLNSSIQWESLFCSTFYATLLGEFDLVNVNLEFDNPLNAVLMDAFKSSLGKQILENWNAVFSDIEVILHCKQKKIPRIPLPLSIASLKSLFPPFMGIALYRSVALTNHSCWPNVEVDFLGSKQTQVISTRSILHEEEILQSYIDEHLPLHRRQSLLQRYFGFRCTCLRCRIEAMEELLRRRGELPTDEIESQRLISTYTRVGIRDIQAVKQFVAALQDEDHC